MKADKSWECKITQASDLCLNDGVKEEIHNCDNTDGTKVTTKTCRCGTSIINPNSVCAKNEDGILYHLEKCVGSGKKAIVTCACCSGQNCKVIKQKAH